MNKQVKSCLEIIEQRSSIRRYSEEKITEAQIKQLEKAALAAPTARNKQALKFSFIHNQELIKNISEFVLEQFRITNEIATLEIIKNRHESLFYGAPLLIVISSPEEFFAGVNAGIAVENLALAAKSMGLESCIIGLCEAAFDRQIKGNYRDAIQLPEDHFFQIAIVIGYAEIEKTPHESKLDQIQHLL